MGAILAMAAVVAVVAGIATVATNTLHGTFSRGTPKPADLQRLLEQWREAVADKRKALIKLKPGERDLLSGRLHLEPAWLKAKNRTAGSIQSIYGESVASFVHQAYPRAKTASALTLVSGAEREIVYRRAGDDLFVSVDAKPYGTISGGELLAHGSGLSLSRLDAQRDGRTVHLDVGDHTLAILLLHRGERTTEPRLFEFVDVQDAAQQTILEVMSFYHLLSENLGTF